MKECIDEIIQLARELNSWCQCCNITDYPDNQEGTPDYEEEDIESITYDVSCAAGDKGVARTPVEALPQPLGYPRNALYLKKLKSDIIKRNKKRKKARELNVSGSVRDVLRGENDEVHEAGDVIDDRSSGTILENVNDVREVPMQANTVYLAEDGDKATVGEIAWAATTSRRGPKEVRKKNVLN